MSPSVYHQNGHDYPTLDREALLGLTTSGDRTSGESNRQASARPLANDPRGEFLAMILHELRNPLNGMQLAFDVSRSAGGFRPEPDWLWTELERAIGQVSRLIDDLMDVCQTTHPTFRLCLRPVDLAAVALSCVQRRRYDFDRKGLWLALEPRPKSCWVMADEGRLELILGNLLDNAAKYTQPGGQVIVSVAVENAQAVLSVQDTGIGIAPENLPRVFEPFMREGIPAGRSNQGSGIGLLLVRTLVELHGGRVEASSPGRGEGTTFVVRLPTLPDGAQRINLVP